MTLAPVCSSSRANSLTPVGLKLSRVEGLGLPDCYLWAAEQLILYSNLRMAF
jgi:hypothetical protein